MTEKPYYETMYILRPDIPEDEVESHLTKYSEILVKAGGEILDNQTRGKRRLAYPISKHKEGIYVQLSHNGNGAHIAIFEKSLRLSEDVIRYLTVKQEGPLPPKKQPKNNNEKKEASINKAEEEKKTSKDVKDKKETDEKTKLEPTENAKKETDEKTKSEES